VILFTFSLTFNYNKLIKDNIKTLVMNKLSTWSSHGGRRNVSVHNNRSTHNKASSHSTKKSEKYSDHIILEGDEEKGISY
jgi:hypothetical protein